MAVTDPSYAGQVTTQISRVEPEVEAMRRGLLRDIQTYFRGIPGATPQEIGLEATRLQSIDPNLSYEDAVRRATEYLPQKTIGALERGYPQMPVLDAQGNPVIDPATGQPRMQGALDYRIAPMSETEREAIGAARAGIGGFQPFLSSGEAAIQGGQNILTAGAIPALQQGITTLGGGQQLINQAAQLAAQQRGMPQTYRQAAETGISGATQLGTQLGQQGYGGIAGALGMGSQLGMGGYEALGAAPFYSVPATQSAQQALQQAGLGAAGVAGRAATGAEAVRGPLEEQLRAATTGALSSADVARMQLGAAGQLGVGAAERGISQLAGTGAQFAPGQISPFMNPYEQAVIDQTMQDIARAGQIQRRELGAQAVGAGAFGGSRQAVAEQELGRNILEQQARSAGQLRAAGYESAAQRAQQAFEAAMGRQQQGAQLTGALGQSGAQTAISAAQSAGQFGMTAEQLRAANAQALAATGLSIQELSAQTGMTAQQLAGQFAQQGAGLAQNQAQLLSQAAQSQGALGLDIGQFGLAGAQAQGALGLNIGQFGMSGAQALGQLGLGYGQLGQQDVEQLTRLAGQQAALGQGIGALAGQYGQFGTQMGQLGVQQAGIGEIGQNLLSSQLQNALAAGGLERGINQSALEAARMSNLQRQTYPLQQFGYLSDIYSGIPTASSVMTASTAPSVSPFQTAVGLGISGLSAAAGAQKAGLF